MGIIGLKGGIIMEIPCAHGSKPCGLPPLHDRGPLTGNLSHLLAFYWTIPTDRPPAAWGWGHREGLPASPLFFLALWQGAYNLSSQRPPSGSLLAPSHPQVPGPSGLPALPLSKALPRPGPPPSSVPPPAAFGTTVLPLQMVCLGLGLHPTRVKPRVLCLS